MSELNAYRFKDGRYLRIVAARSQSAAAQLFGVYLNDANMRHKTSICQQIGIQRTGGATKAIALSEPGKVFRKLILITLGHKSAWEYEPRRSG